ncbi:MAG: hypothetical protein GC186_05505 [Rhodobacteraceae bacterium]|nr:hypothetical protein [Paracoccaceae bacterium]
MITPGLEALRTAVGDLLRASPELRAFADWPAAPVPGAVAPLAMPAIRLIEALSARTTAATAAVVSAVRLSARDANWQHTYTEAEVGRDFLDRYGWFELVGPGGHFHSDTARAYIAFWDAGLHYPMHLHEAEELYYILAGGALFHAEGEPSRWLAPQDTRLHRSNQPHAMDTQDEPVLALILWRGQGLSGAARMRVG